MWLYRELPGISISGNKTTHRTFPKIKLNIRMGDIIQFPGKTKRRKKVGNLLIEKLDEPSQHIHLGHADFTCTNCGHTGNFTFTNVIFKSLDFFCSNCGTGFKISNPALKK
jgi:hypothetical protein